jgi:HEXXH motif-containing protein
LSVVVTKAAAIQHTDFGFAPDAARADRLDYAIRSGLAASLGVVFDALESPFHADKVRASALLGAIEAAPVVPAVFGAYVDLVLALIEERASDSQPLIDDILALPAPAPDGLRTLDLTDEALGAGQAVRYARLLIDDVGLTLAPVPEPARAQTRADLQAGLALLEAGAPEVLAEVRALVREIILVTATTSADGTTFDGASTFSLWGAMALNADRLGDRLTTAVAVAHEAAHNLLFGLALGGRLTENDDDERHPSPLRPDPRPMEGVAHAVYVMARMIYTLRALLASGVLKPEETDRARVRLNQYLTAHADSLALVMAHARFTPAGAAAFDAMRAAMVQDG